MMNIQKRIEKLENHSEGISLFEAYDTHVLVDTREKYEHPERFKEVLDHENESGKWYRLERI